MGRGPEQTYFQRRHPDGQQTHEKMLNITNHEGNEIKTMMRYTCQNGSYEKPQE